MQRDARLSDDGFDAGCFFPGGGGCFQPRIGMGITGGKPRNSGPFSAEGSCGITGSVGTGAAGSGYVNRGSSSPGSGSSLLSP